MEIRFNHLLNNLSERAMLTIRRPSGSALSLIPVTMQDVRLVDSTSDPIF